MTNEKALLVLEGIRMTYICDPNECKLDEYDPKELACRSCYEGHEALVIAIKALKKQNDINRMIDEIESTAWFVYGARQKKEGTEPLYKAEDILKICDKYRSEEVD